MAGRHRLKHQSLLRRGIYWGSRTTRATLAAAVAVAAVVTMGFVAHPADPLPPPAQTAAQRALPAAVAAWQQRVALTTAVEVGTADSEATTKGSSSCATEE